MNHTTQITTDNKDVNFTPKSVLVLRLHNNLWDNALHDSQGAIGMP